MSERETPAPVAHRRAVTMTKVITLCGSTRFPQAFELANMHLSLQGHVVVGLGCFGHADLPVGAKFLTSDGDEKSPEKQALGQLHFRKIDLCDEIFVINVGGYVGSSTKREIAYAQSSGKTVRYMFDDRSPETNLQGAADAYVAQQGIEHSGGIIEHAFEAGAFWARRWPLPEDPEGA